MRHALTILVLLALAALPAAAQPEMTGATLLHGRAAIAGETRDVRFEFLCSSNERNATGALIVNLIIPRHAELRPAFDFDVFEGPDANAGARTRIETQGAPGRFAVSGWIGVAADQPFIFGLSATRRRDAARLAELGRLLRPLTAGAGTLTWTQGNARAGGPEIVARLEVGAEDAARLRSALGPCLAR